MKQILKKLFCKHEYHADITTHTPHYDRNLYEIKQWYICSKCGKEKYFIYWEGTDEADI